MNPQKNCSVSKKNFYILPLSWIHRKTAVCPFFSFFYKLYHYHESTEKLLQCVNFFYKLSLSWIHRKTAVCPFFSFFLQTLPLSWIHRKTAAVCLIFLQTAIIMNPQKNCSVSNFSNPQKNCSVSIFFTNSVIIMNPQKNCSLFFFLQCV